MTKQKPIKTTEDARAYLSEIGLLDSLPLSDAGDEVVLSAACGRCGGTGFGPWHRDGGMCYECHGKDTRGRTQTFSLKAYAQGEKRRRRAREKKAEERKAKHENQLEGQRDWCEKQGHGRITFAELDEKRQAEREATKAERQWIGTPKKREIFDLTLIACPSWEGTYGMTFCHIFVDDDGNKAVWKTSDPLSVDGQWIEKGEKVRVKATVKEHGERDGEKQTRINRLVVLDVLKRKARTCGNCNEEYTSGMSTWYCPTCVEDLGDSEDKPRDPKDPVVWGEILEGMDEGNAFLCDDCAEERPQVLYPIDGAETDATCDVCRVTGDNQDFRQERTEVMRTNKLDDQVFFYAKRRKEAGSTGIFNLNQGLCRAVAGQRISWYESRSGELLSLCHDCASIIRTNTGKCSLIASVCLSEDVPVCERCEVENIDRVHEDEIPSYGRLKASIRRLVDQGALKEVRKPRRGRCGRYVFYTDEQREKDRQAGESEAVWE